MVRCPNCSTETGLTGHCRACGTIVEQQSTAMPDADTNAPGGGDTQQTDTPAQPRPAQRNVPGPLPTGLKVLCVLLSLFGTGLASAGLALGRTSQAVTQYGASAGPDLGGLAVVFVALGLAQFLAIYGLWTRKSWGWTAGMVVLAAGALSSLLVLSRGATANGLFGVALYGGLGWYLSTKRWVYRNTAARHTAQPDHEHQPNPGQRGR